MKLLVNGKELEMKENITVSELLKELKVEDKTMATAVNMQVVKKENWKTYILKEGEKVELLQFVGGG